MKKEKKLFQVFEDDNGVINVVSSDKRQLARWYALDYLQDKASITKNGLYIAVVSEKYYFSPTFRRK